MSKTRQEEPRQPAEAGASGPRERHPFALLPVLWLGFLAWPISDLIAGRDRGPAAVAAVLIAACVVPYVWLTWLEYAEHGGAQRLRLALVAVMAPLALILMVAYGSSVVFALMYLSGACALALPRRQALVAAGVVAATMLAFSLHLRQSAANTVVFVFVTLMAPVVVLGTRRLLLLIAGLHQAREELARLAVAEERLRFARDLHDLLGHSLSLIVVKSQLARKLAERGAGDGGAVAREVRDIEAVAQQSLVEVREAVSGYRRRSLVAELDDARSALRTAAVDATVRTSGTPLPAATEALLAWVVREGVTNVVRHSQARRCEIEIRRAGGVAILEVRDDGRGPVAADSRDGTGLRGLAERVEAVGGHLEAGAVTSAGGFRLSVTVPLPGTAPAPQSRHQAPPVETVESVERS